MMREVKETKVTKCYIGPPGGALSMPEVPFSLLQRNDYITMQCRLKVNQGNWTGQEGDVERVLNTENIGLGGKTVGENGNHNS